MSSITVISKIFRRLLCGSPVRRGCRRDHAAPHGRLPEQCAALNRTNINVQELTIEAALTHKREHIYHAAMLDPHTAAELSIPDIIALCDEMIESNAGWIGNYE